MTLHLLAPAKLNLALEILRRREDGYHEIASIMQTIDLADRLTIGETAGLQLTVSGPEADGVPDALEENLAYRAAFALREEAGVTGLGATIQLEKRVPAGAGLGGGSSDAAAVLRGLDRLWQLHLPLAELEAIAATLGSDVSFFLHGGTALATGRGELIEPLPALLRQEYTLFLSARSLPEKTRRMYGALVPDDLTNGTATFEAAAALRNGSAIPFSAMQNPFERPLASHLPPVAAAMALCREAGLQVVLAGAGPSFFSPVQIGRIHSSLLSALGSEYGITARACRTISAKEALAVRKS